MGIGIEDIEQTCFECGQKCVNRRSLGNHVAKSHKELGGLLGYAIKHITNGLVPLCGCGCGSNVQWHKLLYRFNDFINGHNEAGWKAGGYTPTAEQVEKRNDAIRAAYANKKAEISEKISIAVNAALAKPEMKANLKASAIKSWTDENSAQRRIKHSEAQVKSWSGEAGDVRRKKVFTKEFSEKISRANMARDAKQTSKAELAFYEALKINFPDAVQGKWFNFSERTWCVDVFIPSLNLMIEFDGRFWHGRDRNSDYTHKQLVNMTNDIRKNLLAKNRKLNLLRFDDNVNVSNAKSLDDLIKLAYHVTINGNTIVDGTFKLADKQAIITRDTLIKTLDKSWIENELLPTLVAFLRAHVEYHGWFYPPCDETIERVLSSFKVDGTSTAGTSWLKSTVKSFWDVDGGPSQAFQLDAKLVSVLAYRLGLNNSQDYTYELSNGTSWTGHETFNITLYDVRYGFVVQRQAVSWFKPAIAFDLYKKFLGDINNPVIWDPSIGFSARLLGAAAAYPNGMYIGTDPAQQMISDAETVVKHINSTYPNFVAKLHNVGSEIQGIIEPNSVDFVFTSPPYFNVEKYFDQPGQCWRDYPTLEQWAKFYLVPTFKNIASVLKIGCYCVFNVTEEFVILLEAAAEEAGLVRRTDLDITNHLRLDHFAKRNSEVKQGKKDMFVVFQKA